MKKIIILILLIQPVIAYCQLDYPFNVIKQKDFLTAIITLDSLENQYVNSDYKDAYWQAKGTLYAFLGKYDKSKDCYLNLKPATNDIINEFEKYYSWSIFKDTITNYNVVLFNESHNISSHRAVLYYLLPKLKVLGFKHLAIEALNNEKWVDSTLSERGFPTSKTGFYLQDPIFNLTIRKALELGFELIPYDSYKDFSKRELFQAENIYNNYLNRADNDKLIVYAGYAHICESESLALMAYQLKHKLNEDILTINQVINDKYQINDSLNISFYKSKEECYDYDIQLNILGDSINIPKWYSLIGYEYRLLSDYYNISNSYPYLVQVYYRNEKNSLPVFQYLIENKTESNCLLAFPGKGKYELKIVHSNNTEVIDVEL